MSALIEFFRGIGAAIVTVIQFVINLFKDLVYMIELLVTVVLNIPNYFSWLPSELITLFIVIISVVVMYKILGREG